MNITKLLKQAENANSANKEALKAAKASADEKESLLQQALVLVRSVSEAMQILRLTMSKEVSILAWKKAVVLLGTTAKSLPDYILIERRRFYTTAKEWDVECDWNQKKEMILADCKKVEDLDVLWAAFPDRYRQELRQRLEELAELCETKDNLDQLCEKYTKLGIQTTPTCNKHINRVSWK